MAQRRHALDHSGHRRGARTNYTAGIELMLAADIRVAASDSKFLQFEVQRGLPFGGAMTRFVREADGATRCAGSSPAKTSAPKKRYASA